MPFPSQLQLDNTTGRLKLLTPKSTLYQPINNEISVRNFGALGDGNHDDTQALAAAATAAGDENATLLFPEGTYNTTATVTLPAKTRGLGNATVKWTGAASGTVLSLVQSGTIAGLTTNVNALATTSLDINLATAIVLLEDCYFDDALTMTLASRVTLVGCRHGDDATLSGNDITVTDVGGRFASGKSYVDSGSRNVITRTTGAAAVGVTDAGQAISLTGGTGGSTSGAGGSATLKGGAARAGNSAGGAALVTGGAGSGSSAGGAITEVAGAGGATGAGGAVTVTSGAGGSTSGLSGDLTLATGVTTAESTSASGNVTLQSGAGSNSTSTTAGGASGTVTVRSQAGGTAATGAGGAGGAVALTGGAGGAPSGAGTGGAGGAVTITAGAAGVGSATTGGAGGNVSVTAGKASVAAAAGTLVLASGQGGTTSAGGVATITSGAGGTTSGASGAVTIASGTTTAGSGSATGNVVFKSGAGAASAAAVAGGASGTVTINSSNGGANTGGASGQVGGAGGNLAITGGDGGATDSTGAHAAGAGADVTITAGAGGNASAGTGAGGAGGTISLAPGAGGTSSGGTAGVPGMVKVGGAAGAVAFGLNAVRSTISNGGTVTVAQHRGHVLYQDASGGNVTMTTATAAAIDTDFPDAVTGTTIPQFVASNHATQTSTIAGGTGVTLVGSGAVTQTGGTFLLIKTGAGTWDLVRVG